MKKLFFVPIAFALFSLSACNKWKDFWDDHHDVEDYKTYKIAKWQVDVKDIFDHVTRSVANFTYDTHNNPLTVVFDTTSRALGTNYKFVYDNQNRLLKCYMYLGPNYIKYLEYRKYQYGSNGNIMSDTTYYERSVPDSSEPSPDTEYFRRTTYTYDAQGRITRVVQREGDPDLALLDSIVWKYSYDAKGNLVKPGYTYDNKVNLMRINKVWQFINYDYSKNNPMIADSYNKADLPKIFNADPPNPRETTFLNKMYRNSIFTYEKVN